MKVFKTIKIVAFACLLLMSSVLFSQDDTSDFALWSSVGIKYSPIKKLKLGLEEHYRLKENASVTDEYFTEISLGYEVIKNLKVGGGVRIIRENDNVGKKQGYEKHFRYNFDLSYSHDIKRFSLSYRFRYQNKKETHLASTVTAVAKEYIRFKTGLEYNIRKWPLDPAFAIEMFSKLNGTQETRDLGLNKFRVTFGTDYNLKKFGKLGVYYRFQETINSNFPNKKTQILGLKYTYAIN